jgi:hypothetical protein
MEISHLAVEEFHTPHALSLYIFIYGQNEIKKFNLSESLSQPLDQ